MFAVVFSLEAIAAIATSAALEVFQQWIGVTSLLLMGIAALAWSARPEPKLSDRQMSNYMVSSGTGKMSEPGRPHRFTLDSGPGLVAFGAGLPLGGAYLLLLLQTDAANFI